MSTARDFVTLALKEAGVIGVGQTPLAEDVNDCFTLLNRMLAQWQKKRWIVPSLYDISMIGNGQRSNLIGPGQYWNAQRPDKIQSAYFLQEPVNTSNAVSFPLTPIYSYEDYAQLALKQLASWPQYFFYDAAYPYGNVYIWPIPDATYEIHLILKSPIGFTIELNAGEITNVGSSYTAGTYPTTPLQNLTGFGSGATADITVSALGTITAVNINTNADGGSGDGYVIGDQLTVNANDVGGTGLGFIFTVTDVTDDLDAEFNMPPEFEEAIHYNLTERIISMYNYASDPFKSGLARNGLNTIRKANAQVPTLNMPKSLRNIRGSNFYIWNADAR